MNSLALASGKREQELVTNGHHPMSTQGRAEESRSQAGGSRDKMPGIWGESHRAWCESSPSLCSPSASHLRAKGKEGKGK